MTTNSTSSATLRLARAWYAVVGVGALLLTTGQIQTALAPGSEPNIPNIAAGIGIGLLMPAAALWVLAPGRFRTALAWIGIVAGVAPFLVLGWIALRTAAIDAVLLAAVPTALALLAGARMVAARLDASR
jgi:hypothetical protein